MISARLPIFPKLLEERLNPRSSSTGTYDEFDLSKILNSVADAEPGERNHQLNLAAFKLGQKRFAENESKQILLTACNENGLLFDDGKQACLNTIASGYRAGIEAPASDIQQKIEHLNQKYAFVITGGKSRILVETRQGYDFLQTNAFHELLANQKVIVKEKEIPFSRAWMKSEHRREYEGIQFAPGKELSPQIYNSFRGWTVKPDSNSSCQLWIKHLEEVICSGNREYSEYLLNYFSHIIQRPWDKPSVGIAMYSHHEGVGKDLLIGYFSKILGKYTTVIKDADQLTGKFNAHLSESLLLSLPETVWSGNRGDTGKLKTLLSESETLIERKGLDAQIAKTYFRVIATSNELWSMNVGQKDRRWFALDIEAEPQDRIYFDALISEMNGGGPSALLFYLQNRDISDFDVRRFPKTNAHTRLKVESLRGFPKFYYERLYEGRIGQFSTNENSWVSEISGAEFRSLYDRWQRDHEYMGERLDARKFGRALAKWCPKATRVKRGTQEERFYVLPPIDMARKDFEQELGGHIEWEEPS